MESYNLYHDIATRTKGDIYIGVVGPVRTGKSTFIKKVMDKLVLPNMTDMSRKQRIIDELPQSADGKTVMTTQPKFVPDGGVKISLAENINLNVRLIDCVGYLIDGLEGESRQVRTPWSEKEMPFSEAAELGTKKVMRDHSTIGIMITTDGTIAGFDRNNYVVAEERIVKEMKDYSKPFAIIINSKTPNSEYCKKLKQDLTEKYSVTCICKNVLEMEMGDILEIIECILYEFPLRMVNISFPKWMQMLPFESELIKDITAQVMEKASEMFKMRDYSKLSEMFADDKCMKKVGAVNVNFGDGSMNVELIPKDGMFYKILSDVCNIDISDEFTLFSYIKQANVSAKKYDKLKSALEEVEEKGYGMVIPCAEDVILNEPELLKSGGKSGIRMTAQAPCMHILKVDVTTEVNPIVGTGAQAQEMVKYLMSEYENNMTGIWDTNMFGKSLNSIARDNLNAKMYSMPQEARNKIKKTVGRIVNEGKGGVLCVLL